VSGSSANAFADSTISVDDAPVLLRKYSTLLEMCPCTVFLSYLVGVFLLVAVAWRPIELDTNFQAFVKADGEAMRNSDTLVKALNLKRGPDESRRLEGLPKNLASSFSWHADQDADQVHGQIHEGLAWSRWLTREAADGRRLQIIFYKVHTVSIYYEAKIGNVLTERVLRDVRNFEARLRDLAGWNHFCQDWVTISEARWLCDPGESFAAYAWPTASPSNQSNRRFEVRFDGRGDELLSLKAVFARLQRRFQQGDVSADLYRYFPSWFAEDPHSFLNGDDKAGPVAMRTRYTFLMTYSENDEPAEQRNAQLKDMLKSYLDFLHGSLYPVLAHASEDYEHTRIYYSGDFILSYELEQALVTDVMRAIGSLVFVTLFMWLYIRSLLVSIACFCIIFASVPVAYVLTPAATTTVASFMSLFLITVIDIDVIFVFIDFWDQSESLKSVDKRLVWMISHAGKSCLATSATTSLSFFANLASALQPLREFGLFMGLSVMSVYVLALLFLPPLLVLRQHRKKPNHQVADSSNRDFRTLQNVIPKDNVTCTYMALLSLVECISRCPCSIVFFAFLCLPVFLGCTVANIHLDQGVPNVFPLDHNQVAGKVVAGSFSSAPAVHDELGPPLKGDVCDPDGRTIVSDPNECFFYWCHSSKDADHGDAMYGSCWRGPTAKSERNGSRHAIGWDVDSCSEVSVESRFSAESSLVATDWRDVLLRAVKREAKGLRYDTSSFALQPLEPLVIEKWDDGSVRTSPFFDWGTVRAIRSMRSGSLPLDKCTIQTLCFFGAPQCEVPGWRHMGDYNLTFEDSRDRIVAAQGTRLLTSMETVPPSSQMTVIVTWGLLSPRSEPLVGPPDQKWGFDPTFEPSNPWAQRALFSMCMDVLDDLRVTSKTCWVSVFRNWAQRVGRKFPSRDFDNDLIDWYTVDPVVAHENIWFVSRKMTACRMWFNVDFSRHASASNILEYKKRWDDYVASMNSVASLTANRAWHTGDAWVASEAQVAIIGSTANTIIIECACGWFGIMVFTGDPYLAFLVLFLVIVNISGLVFFMVGVMGWKVGPIEIIFLVVFLGYSVTFGLHIAVNYSEVMPGDRELEQAMKLSMRRFAASSQVGVHGSDGDVDFVMSNPWETTPQEKVPTWNASSVVHCTSATCHLHPNFRRRGLNVLENGCSSEATTPLSPAELRKARVCVAVLRVGGAIVSSTLSTLGSSVFLVVCTLSIFVKLGFVIMIVVGLSITFTLVVLSAVLMLVGPDPEPCCKRYARLVARQIVVCFEGRHQKRNNDCEEFLVPGEILDGS